MRVQQFVLQIAVGVMALGSLPASATCYQVFKNNEPVYRSFDPPVDLGRPLSQAVEERFGSGASMSFGPDDGGCPGLVVAPSLEPTGSDWSSVPTGLSSRKTPEAKDQGQREAVADAASSQNGNPARDLSDYFNGPEYQSGLGSSEDYQGGGFYVGRGRFGSGELHTGPRGGTYTYTASGNKRYLSSGGRGGRGGGGRRR